LNLFPLQATFICSKQFSALAPHRTINISSPVASTVFVTEDAQPDKVTTAAIAMAIKVFISFSSIIC
jgi:hypothetical protein